MSPAAVVVVTDQWDSTGADTCIDCGAPAVAHCPGCYLPEPYRPEGRACDWCPAVDRGQPRPEETDR